MLRALFPSLSGLLPRLKACPPTDPVTQVDRKRVAGSEDPADAHAPESSATGGREDG